MDERLGTFVNSRVGQRTMVLLTCTTWLGSACVSSLLYIGRVFPFQPFTLQWPLSLGMTFIPLAVLKYLEKFETGKLLKGQKAEPAASSLSENDAEASTVRRAKLIFVVSEMLALTSLIFTAATDLFLVSCGVYFLHLLLTVAAVSARSKTWRKSPIPPITLALMINLPIVFVAALIGFAASR